MKWWVMRWVGSLNRMMIWVTTKTRASPPVMRKQDMQCSHLGIATKIAFQLALCTKTYNGTAIYQAVLVYEVWGLGAGLRLILCK